MVASDRDVLRFAAEGHEKDDSAEEGGRRGKNEEEEEAVEGQ